PSPTDSDGNSIVERAAIDPLTPTIKIAPIPTAISATSRVDSFLHSNGPSRPANHAVSVRNAIRINVFIRWPAVQKGREGVQFAAVFPVSTRPPPIAPSIRMNTNERAASLRTI